MKTNGNDPAFANPGRENEQSPSTGLTKREYFAAMALLMLAEGNTPTTAARLAVKYADALIEELNKDD